MSAAEPLEAPVRLGFATLGLSESRKGIWGVAQIARRSYPRNAPLGTLRLMLSALTAGGGYTVAGTLLLLMGAGCGETIRPQVVVSLDAEAGVRARATWIRIRVLDNDGEELFLETHPLQGEGAVPLPIDVTPLAAVGDDARRDFRVESDLFDGADAPPDGPGFNQLRARSTFVDGAVTYLRLMHGESCNDVGECSEGQTCSNSICVGACVQASMDAEGSRSAPHCSECEVCGAGARCDGLPAETMCGCSGQCDGAGVCATNGGVQDVSLGSFHTCARTGRRDLYCWGKNDEGQLRREGAGGPEPMLAVAGSVTDGAGRDFTCSINQNSGVTSCWGDAGSKRLGVDSFAGGSALRPIDYSGELVELALGGPFACARGGEGQIVCWGKCTTGQVGPAGGSGDDCGDRGTQLPTIVELPEAAVQISAGRGHACARTTTGAIYCWGGNVDGQTGDLTGPIMSGILLQEFEGSPGAFIDVSCGGFHTCAVGTDHSVWCWGGSSSGNLGINVRAERRRGRVGAGADLRVLDVACGDSHCCAIEEETLALYCWGGNVSRQLGGTLSSADSLVPVPVAPGLRWESVDLGEAHTCAITEGGAELWCWGNNTEGQLGLALGEVVNQPRRVCLPD